MSRVGTRAAGYGRYLAVVAALVAVAVPVLPLPPYVQSIAIEILIFTIATAALDLLVGFTGLVSLGQAGFLAAGAYAAGLVATHLTANLLITLVASVVTAAVLAAVIGFLAVRSRDVFFLMLTLACGQLVYSVAHQWTEVTGGSNGLVGIPRPHFFGLDLSTDTPFYYLVFGTCALSLWLLHRVVHSPYGQVLIGIRENEHRVRALGYNTRWYKISAFVIAGALTGVAGWLYAAFNGYISPESAHWTLSGELVLMVIIGGSGTLYGSLAGAGLVLVLSRLVSSYTERWPTVLGAVFVGVVLLAPEGLLGLWQRWRVRAHREPSPAVAGATGVEALPGTKGAS